MNTPDGQRRTPVFMNTQKFNSNFHRDRPGHVGADHQHLNNTRQLPSTGRSMVGCKAPRKSILGF